MDCKQNLKDKLQGIKYAISYFSVLPIKQSYFDANKSFYQGVLIGLPIVGLLLSCIALFVYFILPFHFLYNAILVSILYLFLTGFLHLEAVGDTIDGWYASYSKKDVYSVMHEPQVGSIGAVGTFCFTLLLLASLIYSLYLEAYFMIILSLVLSRFSVYFALDCDYHEKSSFIISLQGSYTKYKIVSLFFYPLVLLVELLLKKLKTQLGFLNGDTLGFLIVFVEIVLLNLGLLFYY